MVALAPAAKSTTAAETSSPTTEWKVPPSEATSCWARAIRRSSGLCESVGRDHVDGQQLGPGGPLGQPRAAADQGLALGAAGDRDDDPLLGRPGVLDLVGPSVVTERVVDPVGQPEQGELAQRGQVADPEVRRQRGVDVLGLVDVAVRHPPTQRLGGHVDELDLVGGADHLVGDGLALADAGDPLDLVVERLEVLDVDRGDDVDAGRPDLLDVLGPLLVHAARHVGVRELVDAARRPACGRGRRRCPSR